MSNIRRMLFYPLHGHMLQICKFNKMCSTVHCVLSKQCKHRALVEPWWLQGKSVGGQVHCCSGHNKIHINGKPNTDRPLWPLTFGKCHSLHKGVSVLTETDYDNKMFWVPMHALIDHWHQVLVTLSLIWTCMTSFVDSIMHVYWCLVMCDWFKRQCKRLIDWLRK